jgi:hypothetical protein
LNVIAQNAQRAHPIIPALRIRQPDSRQIGFVSGDFHGASLKIPLFINNGSSAAEHPNGRNACTAYIGDLLTGRIALRPAGEVIVSKNANAIIAAINLRYGGSTAETKRDK